MPGVSPQLGIIIFVIGLVGLRDELIYAEDRCSQVAGIPKGTRSLVQCR